jgi:hypothetical protein
MHTLHGTAAQFLALALLIAGNGSLFTILLAIVTRDAMQSILHARYQRRAAIARLING